MRQLAGAGNARKPVQVSEHLHNGQAALLSLVYLVGGIFATKITSFTNETVSSSMSCRVFSLHDFLLFKTFLKEILL